MFIIIGRMINCRTEWALSKHFIWENYYFPHNIKEFNVLLVDPSKFYSCNFYILYIEKHIFELL